MANTYTSLTVHIVFSTKGREPWIHAGIEQAIWGCLATIARRHGMVVHAVGGADDHVHLLLGLPATMALSRAVQLLKGGSSRWVHEALAGLEGFAWQDGYGAFSVSRALRDEAVRYVLRQREHHRLVSWPAEAQDLAVAAT
ncbi:MAG: IS200/IS605 family transposase [Thermodesulfobacteriota bacterium]